MIMKYKPFCAHCGKQVDYILNSSVIGTSVNEVPFSFVETKAYCAKCNGLVYIPGINAGNERNRRVAYFKEVVNDGREVL